LPLPRFNARVETAERVLEVDLLWDDAGLVLEADSRKHHGIEVAFERDHRRTRELIAAHYGVLRVTWREAEPEPAAVFALIRQELAKRTPTASAPRPASAAQPPPTVPWPRRAARPHFAHLNASEVGEVGPLVKPAPVPLGPAR